MGNNQCLDYKAVRPWVALPITHDGESLAKAFIEVLEDFGDSNSVVRYLNAPLAHVGTDILPIFGQLC
jgi:hypothetical protein